ncbi:LuxR C-terminal-related transcriptional regulator [Microbacterium oleivorans]|uniref:Helix-turn-helix transcriptional regulator n=1 Tax=Microbacterium oleivorans TaxID=273677 RepID=A0A7D5IXW7_9MICO|nr:LuxR C-terminal-related transcriptional regulator [Microbacterium oleivorans]QLD10755.1 helix-turn-helix transcriptional regulator [Microbacterium oleivorans]
MTALAPPDTDAQLVSRAVDDLARSTRFPVVFGGLERQGSVHVTAIAGARSHAIDDLVVQVGRGLGGAAMMEKRPRLALDYRTARTITHDYDRAILGEGIATLFAVPIVTEGRARGVLYCGAWTQAPVGDLVARPAFRAADAVGTELRIRDEVQRRLSLAPPPETVAGLSPSAKEDLRESFAELRSIAATVDDAALRERLAAIEQRLAAVARDGSVARGGNDARGDGDAQLSPRELDVLACCALGSTNAEIAAALNLKEGTVKSYLQAAMAKLDASTRHAAVARARRIGILP